MKFTWKTDENNLLHCYADDETLCKGAATDKPKSVGGTCQSCLRVTHRLDDISESMTDHTRAITLEEDVDSDLLKYVLPKAKEAIGSPEAPSTATKEGQVYVWRSQKADFLRHCFRVHEVHGGKTLLAVCGCQFAEQPPADQSVKGKPCSKCSAIVREQVERYAKLSSTFGKLGSHEDVTFEVDPLQPWIDE